MSAPSNSFLPQAFRALRGRPFLLLWSGQTLSRIGDFAYEIIIAWWVLLETGSAAIMSSVLIVSFLPVAVFTVLGGVLVDRQPRVRVMVAADLIRGLLILLAAVLASLGMLELWAIYLLGLVIGSVDAFFQPAYFALLPEIVPEEDLPSANALTSMSFQLGRVLGPSLGGLLVALGGVTLGLTINSLSFALGGLLLMPLLVGSKAPERAAEAIADWRADLREGFATVWDDPVLRVGLIANTLAASLLVGPFLVALPFLAEERFGPDALAYGLLLSVFPVGFLLGSLWAGRKSHFRRPGRLLFGGILIAALALAVFGLPVHAAWLAVAALINGFALEVGGLAWSLMMQRRVPPERMGRVASLSELGFWLLTPVAMGAAGLVAEVYGPGPTFLIGGLGAALVAGLALFHRAIRHLDEGDGPDMAEGAVQA